MRGTYHILHFLLQQKLLPRARLVTQGCLRTCLLGWTIDGPVVDAVNDVVGGHTVDGAADRLRRAQHLLHHARELPASEIIVSKNKLNVQVLF